jgi:hypothetical protein
MKTIKTSGICAFCKAEIPKNSRSISNHIAKCYQKSLTTTDNLKNQMILLIQGKYSPEYWMVIKARPDMTLTKLDKFLRDIWLECCGHLSDFSYRNSEIPKTRKINQVFEEGIKIDYVYDFGSSTELSISLINEIELEDDKDIKILIRNKEPEFKCSSCDNKAVAICPMCMEDDEGFLCEKCIKNHECVMDEGEDILMPVTNSPRSGECGYVGYENKTVKKYFPKEII